MYTTQGNDVARAGCDDRKDILDLSLHAASERRRFCCGRITRGLAILGDTLFLATVDAHLIAIDAKTGRPLWNRIVANGLAGYSMTLAPLVIKDKVIVGTAGGEFGIRGFIVAYDVQTGKEAWRFNTVPLPGEPGHETWGDGWKNGGGSIWVTGSYDPETNLTFWGVGNPGPDYNAKTRPGDNLYSCSVVALDADTGKLKWHYQFMPHDEFDWDAVQIPVLADISWQGTAAKGHALGQPQRILLRARSPHRRVPAGDADRQAELERRVSSNGRPIFTPNAIPSYEGVLIYPGNQGATNWFNPSYSPRTGLFYVNVWENTHHIFARTDQPYTEGASATRRAGSPRTIRGGALRPGMRASQRPNLARKKKTSARFARSIRRPASGSGNTR